MTAVKKLAKSQGLPPSKWTDGTRRSQGNAFSLHLDGRPSIFSSAKDAQYAAARSSSSANVERQRAAGIEPALVYGLSHKAEEAKRNRSHNNPRLRLPEWIGPNRPSYRRWAAIAPPPPSDQDDQEDAP